MDKNKIELTERDVVELMVNSRGTKESIKYIVKRMVQSYATTATALRANNVHAALVELGRWNELLTQLTYLSGNEDAMNELDGAPVKVSSK